MCFYPITLKRGVRPFERVYTVPCGKCVECVEAKASNWRFRLEQEMLHCKSSIAITFDYNPDNVPFDGVHYCHFRKVDVQNIVRSMRDWFRYKFKCLNVDPKEVKEYMSNFKYFVCSEYGTQSNRPHYHGIFFNIPLFP